ncbi:MAG: hypothetical protein ACXW4Q_12440, partial [Anaerolineales bacterium]
MKRILPANARISLTDKLNIKGKTCHNMLCLQCYRLSHNLLNFWNKLQTEFSTFGLDNYAALCKFRNSRIWMEMAYTKLTPRHTPGARVEEISHGNEYRLM